MPLRFHRRRRVRPLLRLAQDEVWSAVHAMTWSMTAARTGFVALDVTDPLVAWLVYRAEMVSSPNVHERALSFWLTHYLQRQASAGVPSRSFAEELALERLRADHYAAAVSRLTGFYLFEDERTARVGSARWGDPGRVDTIVEVELRPGARTSRHDAEWITQRLGEPGTADWMHSYLRGEPGPVPLWELVVDGRALIFGTRVREVAYDTVSATWPDSLALLELARLGVELGSDLGLITAMVMHDRMRTWVDYTMNMSDAEDPGFLARLREFDGPVNSADLGGLPGRVPDLRNRRFALL